MPMLFGIKVGSTVRIEDAETISPPLTVTSVEEKVINGARCVVFNSDEDFERFIPESFVGVVRVDGVWRDSDGKHVPRYKVEMPDCSDATVKSGTADDLNVAFELAYQLIEHHGEGRAEIRDQFPWPTDGGYEVIVRSLSE